MAVGNLVLASAEPMGRFLEGWISGTPKPGTCVQLKTSEAVRDGRLTYEPYNTSKDGEKRPVIVLLEDKFQGKSRDQAYVDEDRCQLYIPANGDELNMLLLDITGTADDHALGELLMIDDGTGKLVVSNGTAESEPFQLLEAVTDPAADTHALCMFTGQ